MLNRCRIILIYAIVFWNSDALLMKTLFPHTQFWIFSKKNTIFLHFKAKPNKYGLYCLLDYEFITASTLLKSYQSLFLEGILCRDGFLGKLPVFLILYSLQVVIYVNVINKSQQGNKIINCVYIQDLLHCFTCILFLWIWIKLEGN